MMAPLSTLRIPKQTNSHDADHGTFTNGDGGGWHACRQSHIDFLSCIQPYEAGGPSDRVGWLRRQL